MGNKCIGQSGQEFYKSVKYTKFLNQTDPSSKYKILKKVYSKRKGQTTLEVMDNTFEKVRVMKQVSSIFNFSTKKNTRTSKA